jgi:hypothetical protein
MESAAPRASVTRLEVGDVAHADVLRLELVAGEVLENHADAPPQDRRAPLGEVEPVEHDPPDVGT